MGDLVWHLSDKKDKIGTGNGVLCTVCADAAVA
ncbi:hypothetical protein W909_11630 [Dickeya zeae EC1]|nr:hypothetical protein W909_11630 [Dickeya zeae EC1]